MIFAGHLRRVIGAPFAEAALAAAERSVPSFDPAPNCVWFFVRDAVEASPREHAHPTADRRLSGAISGEERRTGRAGARA
jgi:hypothetical protein